MEFSPHNPIVKYCLQGMEMEGSGKDMEARALFQQAWDEASNDFEQFLAAYYLARHQPTEQDTLAWYQTTLALALKINDDAVKGAFANLNLHIAKCYEGLGDTSQAAQHYEQSNYYKDNVSDKGPFYHGTKADLQLGDFLVAGKESNYQSGMKMNHVYFTALVNGAGLAAALAKGEGRERVYIVVPAGSFENDPNVTDKKFPGNPTRSYRTTSPLKIVGEVSDWARIAEGDLQKWREKLANQKGEIIN